MRSFFHSRSPPRLAFSSASIPPCAPRGSTRSMRSATSKESPMPDATILLVDDERNVSQLSRMYLTADGFRVETVYNGKDALERVRNSRPDLVVLDLMMPGMDGWEVC